MPTRRIFLTLAATAPAVALIPQVVLAAEPQVFSAGGAAINGFDPVAYFTDGKPVIGNEDITHVWNGAVFRFASEANRDTFAADPATYAPQYGGYCAYAVAQGYTASTDPEAWTVHDGKLYLNFSTGVRRRWLGDVPGNIAKADANWPGVLQ
jgi:hypothetical protein